MQKTLKVEDSVWIKEQKQFGTVVDIKEDKVQVRYTHDIWGKHEQRLELFYKDDLTKFNLNQFDEPTPQPKLNKQAKARVKKHINQVTTDIGSILDELGE